MIVLRVGLGLGQELFLDGWVDSLFWVFVGSGLRLNNMLGFLLLEALLWLG